MSQMVNVRFVLPNSSNSPPFSAKMFCFEFGNIGLVSYGIVSYSVCVNNVSIALVSTKTLASIPCTLTLMYKPAFTSDDPTPIDPFGVQTD